MLEKDTDMPTILYVLGWRFFFYSNELREPSHIHCQKGERECKYWLDVTNFDVKEAYSYHVSTKDKREVKRIIFEYFEFIESEWRRFQRRKG